MKKFKAIAIETLEWITRNEPPNQFGRNVVVTTVIEINGALTDFIHCCGNKGVSEFVLKHVHGLRMAISSYDEIRG